MSRVGTTNLNLGMYLDGENPGSGPQDQTDSNGLNGDKVKIDKAVGIGHAADGSHKAAVIDAANLASTTVDGSTLEQDTSSKKLRVKDGGITAAKLAASALALITAVSDALTSHKGSADHDAHNDARYASLATFVQKVALTIPITEANSHSKFFGLPGGTITKIIVANESGVATLTALGTPIGITDGLSIFLNGDDPDYVFGRTAAGTNLFGVPYNSATGAPAFVTIVMTLT